jgi:CubicO group peptidase (beta-lactamase class C family)
MKLQNNKLPVATPESQGIPSGSVLRFLERMEEERCELHALYLIRNGYKIVSGIAKPLCEQSLHRIHSAAKTLASAAVLFAVQDGLMSLDEKLVDIFSAHLPETVDERMSRATLYHLLTMSSGHHYNTFADIRDSDDWIKTFLAIPTAFEPGYRFVYNNGTPHLVTEAVRIKTGRRMEDYLQEKLFAPIGAKVVVTRNRQDETDLSTLCTTPESFARMAQFFLQDGEWDSRQLLSRELVHMVGQKHLPSVHAPETPIHILERGGWGFGLLANRNAGGGFRLPGGRNQLGIVMPEHGLNITIMANEPRKYYPMQAMYETFLTDMYHRPIPENPADYRRLREKLENWSLAPKGSDASGAAPVVSGETYHMAENETGVSEVRFDFGKDGARISFLGRTALEIPCGYHGGFLSSKSAVTVFSPSDARLNTVYGAEDANLYSGAWAAPGVFEMNRRSPAREATDFFRFCFSQNGSLLNMQVRVNPQQPMESEWKVYELEGSAR